MCGVGYLRGLAKLDDNLLYELRYPRSDLVNTQVKHLHKAIVSNSLIPIINDLHVLLGDDKKWWPGGGTISQHPD